MATGMNHELHTLQKYKSAIISKIATQVNPEWFSLKLQEKGMISAKNASAIVDNLAWSKEGKVNRLIRAVESELEYGYNPAQIFKKFIEILSSESVLKDLVQELQTEYTQCRTTSSTDSDTHLPSDTAAEESSPFLMKEGRNGQTQVELEWGSHRPHKNPHRCGSRCIVLTCCIVCLSLIAVVVLIFVSRIREIDLRLKRDTEEEIAVPYGISREIKLLIKQELLLWLSCFIICTPWILAQYMCQKTTRKLPVATCCCLLMVGVLYFLKDFECFQISGVLLLPACISLGTLSPVACQLRVLRRLYKHFCLRLLITLLWLTVMMVYISPVLIIGLITALKPDILQEVQENKLQSLPTIPGVFIQQEVQENKLQGLQSLPTVPGVLNNVRQHIKQDIKHIDQEQWETNEQQWDRYPHVQQQSVYIRGAIEFIIGCLLGLIPLVLQVILNNCANRALPIYQDRTVYRSTLCLSILGVVTTFPLFSALLLTVIESLDGELLFAMFSVLLLLQANLVLLMATASIKRLPSNFKSFKNQVVYSGITIGVRNLLLEALVLWKTWW